MRPGMTIMGLLEDPPRRLHKSPPWPRGRSTQRALLRYVL